MDRHLTGGRIDPQNVDGWGNFFGQIGEIRVSDVRRITASTEQPKPERALEIGSRLELFVDDWLIDSMRDVSLKLHMPEKGEVVFEFNAPWEGSHGAYFTVMKDVDRYRLYYRASGPSSGGERTCCAESKDGIKWHRPSYGLVEFNGSRDNNIIPTTIAHNFMPFRDTNPDAPEEERYKALTGQVVGMVSPDGIHWKNI